MDFDAYGQSQNSCFPIASLYAKLSQIAVVFSFIFIMRIQEWYPSFVA